MDLLDLLIKIGLEQGNLFIFLVGFFVYMGYRKLSKIEKHLAQINGRIGEQEKNAIVCRGEIDIELERRPTFRETREIVKEAEGA